MVCCGGGSTIVTVAVVGLTLADKREEFGSFLGAETIGGGSFEVPFLSLESFSL